MIQESKSSRTTMPGSTIESMTGRYEFMAEAFHCDFKHHLFMDQLGNHLLNAADFHSAKRGFGMPYLNPRHKTWVLSRLAIDMDSMPEQYTHFYVETWIESVTRYFSTRDFRVSDSESGATLGHARSIWAMIDTDTRQPVSVLDTCGEAISKYIDEGHTSPIGKLSRVKMSDRAEKAGFHDILYSDLDINGHANSVKYIEHALDIFGAGWHESHDIKRVDMAYVAESHKDDRLTFYKEQTAGSEFCIRITKSAKASEASLAAEEKEVCRCKVTFKGIGE